MTFKKDAQLLQAQINSWQTTNTGANTGDEQVQWQMQLLD